RLPKLLRLIPGTAQDVRAYFLTLQYWLGGSDDNIANMVRYLVNRYAAGDRSSVRGRLIAPPPVEYPENGLYHPDLPNQITDRLEDLPPPVGKSQSTVGVLVMRSYVLARDTAHYDGVIRALEAKGHRVIVAFASGLDSRPAIDRFFKKNGVPTIDAMLSLTGFSLVGGPAFNDSDAAEETLKDLDVPYVSAQAIEFQTLEQWDGSGRGLMPVESTIMVAIPELDGATGPIVFGGRRETNAGMEGVEDRVEMLAARVDRLVKLRRCERAERRIALVLFNFPPNGGATGTAAYLSVFQSVFNTLKELHRAGYSVRLPESAESLYHEVVEGNAADHGSDANVHTRVSADDHVRRERYLDEIETQWGPAPGRQLTDGRDIFVLGKQYGTAFIGIQPGFGYEGDPMRLLFESGFAPTHAFSAFYRFLREDFSAHAVLHFGTHGALEFMPGKQTGLSGGCWPDRLIGDLPSFYLYAANNPSEGTIAKRRAAATLVSYMTPPLAQAGLYRGLLDLKDSIERFRSLNPEDQAERDRLAPVIQAQAAELDLCDAESAWDAPETEVHALHSRVHEYETALIPHGLHVVGRTPGPEERLEYLQAMLDDVPECQRPSTDALEHLIRRGSVEEALVMDGLDRTPETMELLERLNRVSKHLAKDSELDGVIHALDGGFIAPAPGGDLLHNAEVLPTGRNMHGFDPFRLPTAFAVKDGRRQAERLLERHQADGNGLPETVAMVLWGTDNLKTGGGPIGQALALMGAEPRFDSYGRLCGAELISLEELGRPRIDVVMTLSGIFRDLFPYQIRLLAEASYLAASAEEPLERNFIRRNVLEHMKREECDLETAALRVFSNADGAYGSNVNMLVDSGTFGDEDELAEAYERRKSFAYGRSGKATKQAAVLQSTLARVNLAYQNLESVELGVTTIDQYFDTLGGIGRAVRRASGSDVPVYIGDQTRGEGTVRTLGEQVALESRTRMLNPKWYEAMLEHGAEGVRNIEAHVTNTMGWSATTGQVDPWIYKQITETFVLDPELRERMARLNPKASVKLANRLLEAHERDYWQPDSDMLERLRQAGDELEDRLEGISDGVAA
ncbi:MAG: magnesium chelatase subunit H, partial [Myxococcota bacterium]